MFKKHKKIGQFAIEKYKHRYLDKCENLHAIVPAISLNRNTRTNKDCIQLLIIAFLVSIIM